MRNILVLLFVCLDLFLNAQNPTNSVWNFGYNCRIKFSSTIEQSLSEIYTREGTSSLSDSLGNLILYTDGITVWNSQDLVIESPDSLEGGYSSTQSALIIPFPEHDGQYYIFTTSSAEKSFNGYYSGAAYSIVDLNLNGGLGQVTSLNIELIDTTCEKLTGIESCDGGYWIIAHEFNNSKYFAWKLTENGISEPIISEIGIPITERKNVTGNMQLSPNGKKLASAYKSRIELFNFNQTTGEITDYIFDEAILNNDTIFPYGVCFSPDNSQLYVTCQKSDYSGSVLIQYNANASNSSNFQSSKVQIAETTGLYYMGDMEIAPNGYIYVANGLAQHLSSINNPNVPGTGCNFVEESLILENDCYCIWGLHNGVTLKKNKLKPISIGQDSVSCTQITLIPNDDNENVEYLWSNGDTSKTIDISMSNNYWLMAYNNDCSISDTVNIVIYPSAIKMKIPNVFTPNGDSINDYFEVEIEEFAEFRILVYNRWGDKVFESNSPLNKWDGRINEANPVDGVYFWECVYKGLCDEVVSIQKGTVSIIK